MKKLLYLFIFFSFVLFANAQTQQALLNRTKHWRFGRKAGLDFNTITGVPTVFNGSNGVVYEGNSCISDTLGNLLFYCNGDTIWNKNHQPMINGTGLTCDKNTAISSQIIPKPGNPNQYFVFVNGCVNDVCNQGLRYSIVDITLDGGNGAVVFGQKNILVRGQAYQHLAFTKHGNGIDYWMAYAEKNPPYNLCMIPVNSFGPDTNNRVISTYLGLTSFNFRFSPNGNKFVEFDVNNFHFYQFNKMNGQLSNQIILTNDTGSNGYTTYSCEFSSNSDKIYFAHIGGGLSGNVIQQFDLSIHTQSAISASAYSFWDVPFPLQTVCFCGLGNMQLATNGKIYIARTGGFIDTLHVIHNPNSSGAACNFQYNAIGLNNKACNASLPIYPDYYFNNIPLLTNNDEIKNLQGASTSIFPNPCIDNVTIAHKVTDSYVYTLFNQLGAKIIQFKGNQLQTKLNVSSIENGIYFLNIQSSNTSISKKIIINH